MECVVQVVKVTVICCWVILIVVYQCTGGVKALRHCVSYTQPLSQARYSPPPPIHTHTLTQCALQVGSLSVSSQTSQVLVSQPGGTYLPLAINKWALQYDYVCLLLCQCREGELESRDMIGQPQRRNPTSSTSLVANITDTVDCDDLVALCTLDGV